MMRGTYDYILMDLDGTITDPMVGITRCVQYALQHLGIYEEDLQKLCCFIGPPLADSFQEYYGFSEQQSQEAILKYRERFSTVGLYENVVYPGMEELLKHLKQMGKKLMVATSKPEIFARQILCHFRLEDYFVFIGGATLDGIRSRKEEVIKYVLETNRLQDFSSVVMVGDRQYDIQGARCFHLDSIGVLYGYGSQEELKAAGATYIVENIFQLKEILERG